MTDAPTTADGRLPVNYLRRMPSVRRDVKESSSHRLHALIHTHRGQHGLQIAYSTFQLLVVYRKGVKEGKRLV